MLQLIATIVKETLLLWRDRPALLLLFAMPAALMVVDTLVQDNAMKALGGSSTAVVFVNEDGHEIGRAVGQQLRKAKGLSVITVLAGQKATADTAKEAVVRGDFPFCVIVPKGTSMIVKERARQIIQEAFKGSSPAAHSQKPAWNLVVCFDPTVRGSFRNMVRNALEQITTGIDTKEKMLALAAILPSKVNDSIASAMGPYASLALSGFLDKVPKGRFDWNPSPVLTIETRVSTKDGQIRIPSSTQNNVPGWALFGMFFVVMPMSAALIRERNNGTLLRFMASPAPRTVLFSGTILTYASVCMIQFAVILLLGKTLLPLLGAPPFDLGPAPLALFVVALSASLAAAGYGMLVSTVAKTYQQASTFGPLSVVIAAALAGVMIPIYVMPKALQAVSAFSPLAWGLTASQDLLVRGAGISTVWPQVALLLGFASATLLAAILLMRKRPLGMG